MNNNPNQTFILDQETFLEIKPTYDAYKKDMVKFFLVFVVIAGVCLGLAQLASNFIGGVDGNLLAVVLSIGSIPLSLLIPSKIFLSGFVQKTKEYSAKFGTTPAELSKAYREYVKINNIKS